MSAKADVKSRVKKKAADMKDGIAEKVYETKEIAVEKAHVAQPRRAMPSPMELGSVKTGCADRGTDRGSGSLVVSVVVWRRRR